MLSELKTFIPQRLDTEEIVTLSAFARSLEAEYTALNMELPEWISNQAKSIRRELKSRNAEAIASKLRAAKARFEVLKSPDEKRSQLSNEIAELEKQLASA